MIQANSSPGQVYTDLNALQGIRKLGKEDKSAALLEVAKQFESMFVNMMLSSMRQANDVFKEDSLFNSPESECYQGMYDQQLGLTLSSGQGMGLASDLHRQLLSSYGEQQAPQVLDHSKLADRQINQPTPQLRQAIADVEQILMDTPLQPNPETIADVAQGAGGKGQQFASAEAFVAAVYPAAKPVAEQLGVDVRAIVAQAALETGWGRHMITDQAGRNSFNFFGIKADQRWAGPAVEVTTHEYRDGVAVKEKAQFRAYSSLQQGLEDYAAFLQQNQRYQQAINQGLDGNSYGHALQRAGYATDPAYGDKIQRISNGDLLQQAMESLEADNG